MSVTVEELDRLYTDVCYRLTVYKNRYKRYLDGITVSPEGQIQLDGLVLKDDCDAAYSDFTDSLLTYNERRVQYNDEQNVLDANEPVS